LTENFVYFMKILFLVTQSTWGGAQRYIYDLATNLNSKYEIKVAAGGYGELLKQLEKEKIKTCSLKYLKRSINPYNEIRAFFEILSLLKKERPDIIHINSSKGTVLASLAGRLTKTKIIYTVHGSVFVAHSSWLIKKIYLWIEKTFSYFKDKIITVSEFDRQLWLRHKVAPPLKLITIHNGIDFSRINFLTPKKARKKILSFIKHQQISNFWLIGTIAHLYPEKGLKYFIKAANEIKKLNIKNIIFIIIGEGMERKNLEVLIKKYELENIFFLLGEIKKAYKYLKAFDIFVLPSIKEGMPYVLLEAMSANLAIISSKVGGIPEMIEDKENGLLVESGNPKELAKKIVYLLKNPEATQVMTLKARKKVEEDFFLEKMIKKTEEVYDSFV